MATIVTRAGKGSPLTNTEVDANFTNLDTYIDQRGNPLAMAVQVAITAATSASNGIQQLTNTQNNFDTGNFALQWRGSVPDWTPAANVILLNKHDGTNGYILTLLTTGFLRLTINATNFDSTVVTGMTDNYVAMIDVDITAATTTAAGSVVFTLNGVQLGTTLVISARVEEITNGNFDTDLTGWTLSSGGTITWSSGKMRVERVSSNTSGYQAIVLAAGETLFVSSVVSFVSGATADAQLSIRVGASVSSTVLATSNELLNGTSGTCRVSYYSAAGETVYIHTLVYGAAGIYDFDTVTSLDSATVDNTSSLYVCGTSAVRSASQWFSHRLFNRAKTVAENLGMFVNGVSSVDVGGSQTNVFTGDSVNFEGGTAGSWVPNSGAGATSVAVNSVSPISGTYDLKIVTNGTSNSGGYFNLGSITLGEKYRMRFDYKNATSAFSVRGRTATTPSSGSSWATFSSLPAGDGTYIAEIECILSTTSGRFHIFADSLQSVQLDNFQFVNLGITSELLAQNTQTDNGQVLDSSGNKQHALLPAAGASIMGAISARRREVRWTNTWAATSELQYVGGVNQAIIPSNAYIDSLIVIPEGATLTGFTIGNGSNASYYATVNGTITSGVAIYVQLDRRVTDGTNLKLTITPMGAFTGNINTTLVGTELERK
jgi:hypothetical protein